MNSYRRHRACGCGRCRYKGYLGPIMLITLGVLFLIAEFYPRLDFWNITWPIFLIVLGIALYWQRSASSAGHVDAPQVSPDTAPPGGSSPGAGREPPSDGPQVTHG